MKIVFVLAVVAVGAMAAPQGFLPSPVAILRDERQHEVDGTFNYNFEAENGINVEASGNPGSVGQTNMQGSYRYPLDDGRVVEVRYVADEFGYVPQSDWIPTPHPLPAHALEQIRVAEEQRARGITFQ